MGKDIHLLTEVKQNNIWQPIEDIPESYDVRNYELYNFLENIGEGGIPEELKGKKFRYNKEYDFWEYDTTCEDLFGFTYISLENLINETKKLNKVTVSEEFLELFFELGGILPEGMSLDEDGKGVKVDVLDEYERYTRERIDEGIKELKEIANKYNVSYNEIRLCYAFDW
jgi:hypothetical protein